MPKSLADWQTDLDEANDEISKMIGSVNGQIGQLTVEQRTTHTQLLETKATCEDMIARLGGAGAEHSNVLVTDSDSAY